MDAHACLAPGPRALPGAGRGPRGHAAILRSGAGGHGLVRRGQLGQGPSRVAGAAARRDARLVRKSRCLPRAAVARGEERMAAERQAGSRAGSSKAAAVSTGVGPTQVEDTANRAATEPQEQETHVAKFDWKSNWYAVGAAQGLDPKRPNPITVLGRKTVLWRDLNAPLNDSSTPWRCFLDQCPHRLVPLSEGRIQEDGLLQCSYHGWTFAGDGACQGIPQAAASGPEHSAISSPKACAKAFPVKEIRGVLFVWPDWTPEGHLRAASTAVPLPVGLDESFRTWVYTREVDYGFDMLAENVMDPSHLPFAHHGVGTLNRSMGAPYPHASIISETEEAQGFVGRMCEGPPRHPSFTFAPVHFQAPGLFVYHRSTSASGSKDQKAPPSFEDAKEISLEEIKAGTAGHLFFNGLYITPVSPGRSRLTILDGTNRPLPGGPVGLLFKLRFGTPWVMHLFYHQILDGDAYFLHAQERILLGLPRPESTGASPAGATHAHAQGDIGTSNGAGGALTNAAQSQSGPLSAYFLPTVSDRFVIGFRKWLERHAGGQVAWPEEYGQAPLSPDWAPKEVVLNRYTGHTAHCVSCSNALGWLQKAQKVLWAAALVLAVVAMRRAMPLVVQISLVLVSAGLAGVGFKIQQLMDQFVYTGWDHTTKV